MVTAAQSVTAPVKYQTFIGGRWFDAANGAMLESEDPSGEKLALVPRTLGISVRSARSPWRTAMPRSSRKARMWWAHKDSNLGPAD
jgi:hypothetical protein